LPPDLVAFLDQPGQLAILGTLSQDGYPHLTPVWYQYEDSTLWVWTPKRRQKYRNTLRQNKVGLYIQAVGDMHKGITLQGTVLHVVDGLRERCAQIASRYVTEQELDIWIEHMLYSQNVLLRITPTWFARNGSSWNL